MTYANRDVYDGKWLGLERHGQGKMTYANGDVFEGVWKRGKRGEGVLKTHKDQILALVDEHIRDLDSRVLWKLARQLPGPAINEEVSYLEQLRAHPALAFANQTVQVAGEMLKSLVDKARLAVEADNELSSVVMTISH